MNDLYLVDLSARDERSATVLVEASGEQEAREVALRHVPETEYHCFESETETLLTMVQPDALKAETAWGEYEVRDLLRITPTGKHLYPSDRPRARMLFLSEDDLRALVSLLERLETKDGNPDVEGIAMDQFRLIRHRIEFELSL